MWYYAINGQSQGPLDDSALDQLVAAGTVTAGTFVWKEGLAEWMPLGQVRALKETGTVTGVEDAASSTCSMCGKSVGADNLIELLGRRVCAACKPTAVQAFREGVNPVGVDNAAWRDGKKVVTHDRKSLPARCYKCNRAVDAAPMKRKLYWHPALYYLLIFVSLIIYVVVAMIVRKRAAVDIYLCSHHIQRRRYFIIGGWSGTVLGFVMMVMGIVESTTAMTVAALLVILVSAMVGIGGASLARATRIKGDTVWLGGASPDFLASLPPWT